MSHSVPVASTLAKNFWSSPLFFTFTCKCSTDRLRTSLHVQKSVCNTVREVAQIEVQVGFRIRRPTEQLAGITVHASMMPRAK
jgi:hypothetical protein